MGFLGIYKAVYDYEPQAEGELALTEGDILYVLETSGEDDWWKAKKKAAEEEGDEPIGLIPNNYVEKAQPTHKARALYDYARQTDEEVSFAEDAQLDVYDVSDPDWTLVGLDEEFGFAPANYIEVVEDAADATPAGPPSLPRRRPSMDQEHGNPGSDPEPETQRRATPQGPAAAIAGIMRGRSVSAPKSPPQPAQLTPEATDEEEPPTPTLPARPKSIEQPSVAAQPQYASAPSPVSPGVVASPPHNRVMHGRNIDDDAPSRSPGGFRMYNINEMVTVMGKRKKMPTTLGLNIATGTIMICPEKARDGPEQTWTAEKMTHYSIEGKHVFLELVRPSKSIDFHAGAKDTAEEIVSALGELAGALRSEGLREILAVGAGAGHKKGQMLYDFQAQGDDEVTVAVGDEVLIIDDTKSDEWWQVRRVRNGKEGVVPSSYVEVTGYAPAQPGEATRSVIEQNRREEERLAKESLRVAKREESSRAEVGPGLTLPDRGSSLSDRRLGNSVVLQKSRRDSRNGSTSNNRMKPDLSKIRTWTDRSKSFSVEAQFLALQDGKIHLHKMNGVKIAVPVGKMSKADLEYVERLTGASLTGDKTKSTSDKQRARPNEQMSGAGASIERAAKPEYDWFQFFLSCDVAVGLCERYAQTFARDSMDESVLSDVDAAVLRNLGLREGDIIKVMRFLDKKYGRSSGKRDVNQDASSPEGEGSGSLFSGPGGTLKNNTRKGRPAPTVQTNDVVDAKTFLQEDLKTSRRPRSDSTATPLASAPPPIEKDPVRNGFEDDAWDVKLSSNPSRAAKPATATNPNAPPSRPAATGALSDLTLLTTPLQPAKLPEPAPVAALPNTTGAVPQPQPVTPSIFAGIGNQQTGLPPQGTGSGIHAQQTGMPATMAQAGYQSQSMVQPSQQAQFPASTLAPAMPPSRPLSAPQTASSFPVPPPLQQQVTGFPAYQPQIAPPGQSLQELSQQRQQQLQLQQQQQQQQQQQKALQASQQMSMMPQATGFAQFNNGQQFQRPSATGFMQGNMLNGNGPGPYPQSQAGPFSDIHQFSPPLLQPQATGFQSAFPVHHVPQQTGGVNTFLQAPLQPQPTGMSSSYTQAYTSPVAPPMPPMPPMPTQAAAAPLVPQKTGPAPPVRFGISNTKKIGPQVTGRRANLAQATPQNPFGF